jgi:hypothetical protein
VETRQEDDRIPGSNRAEVHTKEGAGEIDLTSGEGLGSCTTWHVLNLVEPFNV